MITETFDNKSNAIINPSRHEDAPKVDACIMTFSYKVEEFVLENYECETITTLWSATGPTPVYAIHYEGRRFAFFKTYVGAPAAAAMIEDTLSMLDTTKYIIWGGAGCLNKEIARGRVMVPTEAYRDEGTSYHYAPAADYITIKNSDVVAAFMEEAGLPYVQGRTWTTDAFYRETVDNFEKRKADGCISVEMESAALEAVCDFRDLDLYVFFTSGDLLDAPKWDQRLKKGQIKGTQHDAGHFSIALELARYAVEH